MIIHPNLNYVILILFFLLEKLYFKPYGMFGWRGKGGEVKGSRVELTKNKLILYLIYSILL